MISIEIPGRPVPQGSHRIRWVRRRGALGAKRPVVVHDAGELAAWRLVARAAARSACARPFVPFLGPVAVELVFGFVKPARARRSAPCVRPDLDKLARAALDVLSGIAFADDGQVVELAARKVYAPTDSTRITIRPAA